jgi:hypothetical protein
LRLFLKVFIDGNDFLKVLFEILADFVGLEVIFEKFWGFATRFLLLCNTFFHVPGV